MTNFSKSIPEIHGAFKDGTLTPTGLLENLWQRIEDLEPKLGALLFKNKQNSMERARALEKDPANHELPLYGIPVVVKDNICISGTKTTCASRLLENYVSPFSATVWQRLENQGAILLAKANLDEFAMGSSTEHSALQTTTNPWGVDRVPGGSSGGSAVAVAAGYCPIALGSSTGGSVRQPASLCGVSGFKPSYGRLSRYGLVAFASSLDHISFLTRNANDARIALQHTSGRDPLDATSKDESMGKAMASPVVGVLPEENLEGCQPEVKAHFAEVISRLKDSGVTIKEVQLPTQSHAVATYYVLATAEASSNLARFDGIRYGLSDRKKENLEGIYRDTRSSGFGPEVKRRIMVGTHALSAGYCDKFYRKAQLARQAMVMEMNEVFSKVDLLMTPTSPTTAFRRGERADPIQMYLCDLFTIPANLCGIPAISTCTGFADGLPLGTQMMAPKWHDERVLAAGEMLENLFPDAQKLALTGEK